MMIMCFVPFLDHYRQGTVYVDPWTGKVTYKLDKLDRKRGSAYGFYNNTIHSTGWGVLEIRTQSAHHRPLGGPLGSDAIAKTSYAAGMLEGLLTARYLLRHIRSRRVQADTLNLTK